MKRSRFSEEQITGILKEHQAGISARDLSRKHGISDATFYTWRKKLFRHARVGCQAAEGA